MIDLYLENRDQRGCPEVHLFLMDMYSDEVVKVDALLEFCQGERG